MALAIGAHANFPEEKRSKPTSQAMVPMIGYAWNPLRQIPRNNPCPCRSGRKFKACCLNTLPPVVPEKAAEIYREQMNRPELIFVTKANEEFLRDQGVKVDADEPEVKSDEGNST